MSDFLSNFNKGNYDPEKKTLPETTDGSSEPLSRAAYSEKRKSGTDERIESNAGKRRKEEATEFDPTYKKRQQKKRLWSALAGILIMLIAFFTYYQLTHVKLPDFTDKEIAKAREWADKENIKIELEQKYDDKKAANQIMSQYPKAEAKIKKGGTLKLTASSGADPEQQLTLPDFMQLSKAEAEKWIEEHQTMNISVIEEYHDTEENGKALRTEFASSEVTSENYRRKDKLKLYYSKGKETYTKTISVPDFSKKTRAEVETWAKNNEIEMTYEEQSSTELEADTIISQSIAKEEKIAKKTQMTVVVSLGKGIIVPDFSEYTIEEAQTAVEGLTIQVKTVFTENLNYGQLVSQSVPPGSELTSKDDQSVKVVYSAGQPYLKDLRGTTVEGDLQKLFYEEYQSKGANISYQIRYVDSVEAKGTVVAMNTHSQYLPLNYIVYLDISLGNLSGTPQYGDSQNQDDGSGT